MATTSSALSATSSAFLANQFLAFSDSGIHLVAFRTLLEPLKIVAKDSTIFPKIPKPVPSVTFLIRLTSGLSLSRVAISSGIHAKVLGKLFFRLPAALWSSDSSEILSTVAPAPALKAVVPSHLTNGSANSLILDALLAAPRAPTPVIDKATVGITRPEISLTACATLLSCLPTFCTSTPGIRLIVSTAKSATPKGIAEANSPTSSISKVSSSSTFSSCFGFTAVAVSCCGDCGLGED